MRKFTTTHTVYTFDELSKEAKQKAIEQYREGEDFPWLHDDMTMKLEDLLKQHGITYDHTPNVYYSLSYAQGDGAMFEGTVYWKAWRIEVRQNGHYYHHNSKTFWNAESVKTGKKITDKALKRFNDVYVEICKELERFGYSVMEDAISDENISTYLGEMDCEFYADGSIL